MKRKTKQTLKTVALSVLGIGAIVGACAGINAIVEKQDTELKTIHPTFAIGELDENGKYVESDQAIYTKKAFEFTNLEITLDFENDIEYAVHFYDENGDFLGATENKDKKYSYENDAEKLTDATHARLVIYPQWSNVEKEDQKVTYLNMLSYASQLTIKVDNADVEDNKDREFTIYYNDSDTETYSFEKGMTWLEFCESEYNLDDRFGYEEDKLIFDTGYVIVYGSAAGETIYIKVNDVIDETITYEQYFQ